MLLAQGNVAPAGTSLLCMLAHSHTPLERAADGLIIFCRMQAAKGVCSGQESLRGLPASLAEAAHGHVSAR